MSVMIAEPEVSGQSPSIPPRGRRARPLFDPPIVRRAVSDRS